MKGGLCVVNMVYFNNDVLEEGQKVISQCIIEGISSGVRE